MDHRLGLRPLLQPLTLATAPVFVTAACAALPPGLFAVDPVTTPSPQSPTVCQSADALGATVEDLGEQATLDASVVTVGESIVEIGTAMDVLAVQLRTPCPTEGAA